jgi:hypothetical protein
MRLLAAVLATVLTSVLLGCSNPTEPPQTRRVCMDIWQEGAGLIPGPCYDVPIPS